MTTAVCSALLAWVAAFAQVPEPAPPSPFDRVETVTIGEPFEYLAEFSGTVFVWPEWVPGAPPLVLQLDDAINDGDGEVRTPCIKKKVEPGSTTAIVVTAAGEAEGTIGVHFVAAPETDATRSAAAAVTDELASIQKLREAGQLIDARQRLETVVDAFLGPAGPNGAEHSDALALAAWKCGSEGNVLFLLQPTERAFCRTLVHWLRTLPEDHLDLAMARGYLAAKRFQLGDLHGARALQEQVLAVRARTQPEDHPDLAQARGNLALTLGRLGDLHGARALQEQVLAVRSRTLPENHPDLARAREHLAGTLFRLGDLHGARALEEQVLAVLSRTLPEDHPDLALARGNFATTLHKLGDLHGARAQFEQALAVLTRILPENHPNLTWVRGALGSMLCALGDLHGARELQEQALAVLTQTLPEDHQDLAFARESLAITLSELGDVHRARALKEQVLAVWTRTLPSDHPDLAWARGSLAALLDELGDVAGARALQEQVLAVLARTLPEDHPELAWARSNLAVMLRNLGDLRGARVLQERVLAARTRTLPEDHPDLAWTRGSLAVTLVALGDLHGARALQEQVLAVRMRTLPEDHPDLAAARGSLAGTLAALGDLRGARALQEQVLAVQRRTLPEDHADVAWARGSLAVTLARQHAEEGKGEGELYAALALGCARSLGRRACAAWLEGSTREVEERLARGAADFDRVVSLAQGLGVFPADAESMEAAFVASECTRGAAVIASTLVRSARTQPGYAEARAALAEARTDVAHAGQGTSDRDIMEEALSRREAAERELVRIARESGAGAVATVPDVATFAAALDAGQAAVAFRRYVRWTVDVDREHMDERFCAFVLPGDGPLACVDLGPTAPIEAAIEDWRSGISASAGRGLPVVDAAVGHRPAGDGSTIRRLVWDPLLPVLRDARRVLLVADDVLHTVAFDALPLGGGELLGDRIEIEERLALTELLVGESAPGGAGNLIVLGDAAFGPVEGAATSLALRGGAWETGFAPLPHTGEEARGLAGLFGEGAILLERSAASRDGVAELAPCARFVHLATHGWFAPDSIRSTTDPEVIDSALGVFRQSTEERIRGSSPMVLCGLALAGANLPADELGRYPGLVTAEEIAGWDLSNCELAVLSACDTNVGLRRAGQGVASLQKALHIAGARSVITSLWKVPDEATKDLMLDFYRRFWVEQKPKRQALWEAKMALRAKGAPTRDWAAWVLTGDP